MNTLIAGGVVLVGIIFFIFFAMELIKFAFPLMVFVVGLMVVFGVLTGGFIAFRSYGLAFWEMIKKVRDATHGTS